VDKHRKGLSLFQLIDRKKFDGLVKKWGMDKGVRSLSTWEMTQALLCCFVMRLGSFREVEESLGIADSTFGDALRARHFGFYQDLCDCILIEIRARTQSRKVKKAIRQILAIDSSDIRVHGSLFTESGWKPKHTIGHKAAAKLHVVWNVDGQWIDDFLVTPGRRGDSPVSLELRLLPDKMYVFDRAYNDFDFWKKIIAMGSDFVTRLKDCKRNRALQKKVLRGKKDKCGVLFDGSYHSTSISAKKSKIKLRQVIYRDRLTKKIFHFVTSDRKSSAKAVTEVYKRRWAVELLFRGGCSRSAAVAAEENHRRFSGDALGTAEKYSGMLHSENPCWLRTSGWLPLEWRSGCGTYVMSVSKINRSAVNYFSKILLPSGSTHFP
jgi:hypothetical protein